MPFVTLKYANLDFTKPEVDELVSLTSAAHSAFGGTDLDIEPPDVDAPRAFKGESLLRSVEATAEMLNVSEYAELLLIRIRSLAKGQQRSSLGCFSCCGSRESCLKKTEKMNSKEELAHAINRLLKRFADNGWIASTTIRSGQLHIEYTELGKDRMKALKSIFIDELHVALEAMEFETLLGLLLVFDES